MNDGQETRADGAVKLSLARSSRRTILVVDDDEIVLDYVASVLTGAGYHVMTAHGPELALYVAEHYPGGCDLLVTDYQMPNVDGIELAKRLIETWPTLAVLVMSGRDRDEIPLPKNAGFIQKPFRPSDLLTLVVEFISTSDLPDRLPIQSELEPRSNEKRKVS